MIQCIAYLRVSSQGQLDGDGLTRQAMAVRAYAQAHGFRIVHSFKESKSGTKEMENRPALAQLLNLMAENGSPKVVLIEKLDRLARDLMIQETILGDIRKHGGTLISTYEPDLCSDDPTRKLMRQIMGAIAEYDRAMIVLKMRAARERLRAKGMRVEGGKPYGEHPQHPEEREILQQMLERQRAGETFNAITDALNAQQIPPRRGIRWYPSAVQKILMRQEAGRHPAEPRVEQLA